MPRLTRVSRCGSLNAGGGGERSATSHGCKNTFCKNTFCTNPRGNRRSGRAVSGWRGVAGGGAKPAADRSGAFGFGCASLRAPAHRGQPAAIALPDLRQSVCPAIPPQRNGAIPGKALLVGAGVSAMAVKSMRATATVVALMALLAQLPAAAQPLVIQEPDRYVSPSPGYYRSHRTPHSSHHRHHEEDAAGAAKRR